MATIIIDGNEYTLPEGEPVNVIQAAMRFGIEIPYYCWHPALSVVANCRMCEIEVGSRDPETGEIKMVPKLVPGCQTPAKDGTVLVTNSDRVKSHQRMIMEYLLMHHPLDCPVCDMAGMCGLQDFSFQHGQSTHRFVDQRIINPPRDVSDKIALYQDRCIMCTRCVRFTREVSQTGELQVINRGNRAEIDTFPGEPCDNPMAGNVVDLCPVGALLDKDFLHKQRFWFLQRHESICTRCSTGCNIYVEENRGRIWRYRARTNPHVNDYWICDEGRYSYKAANDPNLLSAMYVRQEDRMVETPIDQALTAVGEGFRKIHETDGVVAGIISPHLTVEEAYLFASYIKGLNPANVLALGPVPHVGTDQTFTPDQRKGRAGDTSFVVLREFTIHGEKCPNRHGVEEVLKHFQGEVIRFENLASRITKKEFQGLYVTSGAIDPAYDESDANAIRGGVQFLVVQDTHVTPLAQVSDVALAGATFAEKAGSYVNFQGRLQYAEASLPPREGSLPDLDIFAILANRHAGPVSSSEVLADVARDVPAFAVVKDGQVPRYGVILGQPDSADDSQFVFEDLWLAGPRKLRGQPGVSISQAVQKS